MSFGRMRSCRTNSGTHVCRGCGPLHWIRHAPSPRSRPLVPINPEDATVNFDSPGPSRGENPGSGTDSKRLSGRSVASIAAVVLALTAAVIWEAVSGEVSAQDADSAAQADFDMDSAAGSDADATATPSETTGTAQESESLPAQASGSPGVAEGQETTSSEAEEDAESASVPLGTGVYQARQEASGLCMTWGEEPGGDGRSVMVLGECSSTEPELTWIEDGGSYEVEMAFEDWTPCMTVDNGGTEDGMLVGFDGCDGLDAQTWELVPAGGAHQLRTAASASLCLSVLKSSSAEAGDAVALQNCDASDSKQLWTLL